MKNKHIELVQKWLADKNSVSHAELVANSAEAADAAAYWVKRYEELTKCKVLSSRWNGTKGVRGHASKNMET